MKKVTVKKVMLSLILLIFLMSGSAHAEKIERWLDSPGAKEFPNSKVLVLLDEIEYTLNNDRSTMLSEHEVVKILTKAGQDKFRQVFRYYRKPDQALVVEIARIIKPNGEVVNLNFEKEIIQEPKFAKDAPMYEDVITVTLDFSALEINDIVEFKLTFFNRKNNPGKYFSGVSFVQVEDPILESSLTVNMYRDADLLKWYVKDPSGKQTAPIKSSIEGGEKFVWTFKNMPPILEEPSGPAFKERASYVLFSTYPSWAILSATFYRSMEPYLKPDERLKKKVAEIIKDNKKQEDIISTISGIILEKERLNLPFMPSHLQINMPGKTLDSNVSSRLDSVILFIAMLRAAGIEAYPAFMSDQKYGEVVRNIPSPDQFNQIVAEVKVGNVRKYIDFESSTSGRARLSSGQEGCDVLPILPGGADFLVTPVSKASENLEKLSAIAQLSPDGSMGINFTMVETGNKKIFWDTFFSMLRSSESQNMLFAKMLGMIHENAKLLSYSREQDSKEDSIELNLIFMVNNYPQISGKYWIVKMPLLPPQENEFTNITDTTRKTPVVLGSTSREVRSVALTIPDGLSVTSLPSNIEIKNSVGELKVKCTLDGNTINYNSDLVINKLIVPAQEYADLVKLYRQAYKSGSEVILLEQMEDKKSYSEKKG